MTIANQKEVLDKQLYEAYWRKLQQFKFDLIYYAIHFNRCTTIIRAIKYIVIGITSLATGAWITWNAKPSIGVICAVLIWLLQGVSALSEKFPFEGRRLELREMIAELEPLYIQMENEWRTIQSLEMDNQEIRKAILQYDQRQLEIKKHYFKDDALPERKKAEIKANDLTEKYFATFM